MRISVVLASYNGEKYIQEQIESILPQLHENDEIIISDDNSTDSTLEIVKIFRDNRIKLIENKKRSGIVRNFEIALNHATGDIIFLSDQDDVWLPDKVKTMLPYLRNYDLVMSNAYVVDENKNIKGDYFQKMKAGKGLFKNLYKNTYTGCMMAFRREVLEVVLPFPKHIPQHDIWIGFMSELFFKIYFIDEPFILFRRHAGNNSSVLEKSKYGFFQKVMFRINIIRSLPKAIQKK